MAAEMILNIILYSVVMLTGLWLTYISTRNVLSPVFWVIVYWMCAYIGGIWIYLALGHSLTPLCIALGVFAYGLGTILCRLLSGFSTTREWNNWQLRPVIDNFKNRNQVALLSFTITMLALLFLVFRWLLGFDPFIHATRSITYVQMRENFLIWFYRNTLNRGLPLLSMTSYLIWRLSKNKMSKFYLLLFLLTTISLLLAQIWWVSRGYLLGYLVFLIMCEGLVKKRSLAATSILALPLIVAGLVGAVLIDAGKTGLSFDASLARIFHRIFWQQSEAVDYFIYRWVPTDGFLMGKGMLTGWYNILAFLQLVPYKPYPGFQAHAEVYSSKGANMVTIFIGDYYLDWGFVGVVIGAFLLGILMYSLFVWTIRGSKDALSIAFKIYIMKIGAGLALGGGYFSSLLKGIIIGAIFLFIFLIVYTIISLPSSSIIYFGHKMARRKDGLGL